MRNDVERCEVEFELVPYNNKKVEDMLKDWSMCLRISRIPSKDETAESTVHNLYSLLHSWVSDEKFIPLKIFSSALKPYSLRVTLYK